MRSIDERTGKPKIILDLCGGTGSWSRFYLEAGYDVRNITLPEHDVLTYEPPENVYGILAAPPLHRVFNLELQGGGTKAEAGGRTKDSKCLHPNHKALRSEMVGYGESGRGPARVYGGTRPNIPALGIW